jgi:MFS family permease
MYICSLFISIVASVLCAISSNVTMLIIFRAIQACGASSGQTLGAGVIADTIHVANRGKAYGVFYIGYVYLNLLANCALTNCIFLSLKQPSTWSCHCKLH